MPVVFGVVSLVLVAVALTFALSSPPPSTPPLAEVAPAPQERIEVERVEQQSRFGEGAGEGDCAPGDDGCTGAATEATEPRATPSDTGRPRETSAPGELRPCVNGPGGLRQTADPQSPPCKREIFDGDNGGATSPGVTSTTIRLAYPVYNPENEPRTRHNLDAMLAHINARYELYGRRIEPVELEMPGETTDPTVQRSHARRVAEAEVFAALSYESFGAFQRTLRDEAIINFVDPFEAGPTFEQAAAELHPFTWSVLPGFEESLTATGTLICSALAGSPARHGGSDFESATRRFGLLVESPTETGIHLEPAVLLRRLEACGVEPIVQRHSVSDGEAEAPLRKFQANEVTTVVCLCMDLTSDYTEAAEGLGYRPEWLLPGISDRLVFLRSCERCSAQHPRKQLAHVFGLTPNLRQVSARPPGGRDRSGDYWWHAAKDGDPDYDCYSGSCRHSSMFQYGIYAQLLTLASGIQWAGPDLTPQSFADALLGLDYPNPGVGEAPWYQPAVGFGQADHGLTEDFALLWWRDPDDAGYESRTDFGEVCYVGNGTRFTAADIPADADELFFDPEAGCR